MFGAGGLWSSEGRSRSADDSQRSFDELGFIGPMALLSAAECRRIVRYLRRKGDVPGAEWRKGRAVTERTVHEIAAHPRIVKALRELLGEDIILWGASIMDRAPGETQPWHTDIESASPAGGFVTVWIGLENTSAESGLRIVSRSHRLRKPVQEARHERGIARELATDEEMLSIVRELEPDAAIMTPVAKNGQALLFDGLLWHMGSNTRRSGRRLALILQYAKASCPVRIPDLDQLDWPFRFHDEPRPPVIVISGKGDETVNRIVAPPPAVEPPHIGSVIHHFDWPGHETVERFRAFPAFGGATRTLEGMHCHASILAAGHSPHRPHVHPEEELLVPIDGEVELSIAKNASDRAPRIERIRPGTVAYYPAGQHHTIRNPSSQPVRYLMLKWTASRSKGSALPASVVSYGDVAVPDDAPAFWTHPILDGATAWLQKLHSHLTILQPGGGYAPHRDRHEVAIVLLSGTVETLGKTVKPLSVIYYSAGELHGMKNAGTEPARYLVFEFHPHDSRPVRSLLQALARSARGRAKDLARPLWRRIKRRRG